MSPPASARRSHRPHPEGAQRPWGEGCDGRMSGGGPPGVCPERSEPSPRSGAISFKVHGLKLDQAGNRPKCKGCGKICIDAGLYPLAGHPGTLVASCRKCHRVFAKLNVNPDLAAWLVGSHNGLVAVDSGSTDSIRGVSTGSGRTRDVASRPLAPR